VANPDLPRRLAKGLPLAAFDPNTLFGGSEAGYSDYPGWSDTRRVSAAAELEVVS
jgi:N-ethylmaleimide reductase